MNRIILVATNSPDAPKPEDGRPDPARLIAGDSATRTWNFDTRDNERLHCGIWESTPGKVTVNYDEWEFCHFIEGEAVLTNEAGESWTLKQGDAFIIPPGFKGTWETVKAVRKHYVILLPAAAP